MDETRRTIVHVGDFTVDMEITENGNLIITVDKDEQTVDILVKSPNLQVNIC